MFSPELEELIDATLTDAVLTEKEKEVLFRKAKALGVDLDEFEIILEAKLLKAKEKKTIREQYDKTLRQAEETTQKTVDRQQLDQNILNNPHKTTSHKYGEMIKCPFCGAIVPPLKGACPECGHEFSNVEAALSIKNFEEKLSHAHDVAGKLEVINSFPIPNTKSDLFELLLMFKNNILHADCNKPDQDKFVNQYFLKYSECVEKVKVLFPNDKDLKVFIDEYSTIRAAKEKIEGIYSAKSNRIYAYIIGAVIVVIIMSIFFGPLS